jgi:hypothetical protein
VISKTPEFHSSQLFRFVELLLFVDELSKRHPDERLVVVIDGAGWHRSHALRAPPNIYLLKLPPYAPELNPIEHVWDELREKFFHNRVFESLDALEDQLALGLRTMEDDPERLRSIVLLCLGIGSWLLSLLHL